MFESIKILSNYYPLNSICNALGVNRSSYLYWFNISSSNEFYNIQFFNLIIKIYAQSNGIYGSPKITHILNNDFNISCSISKVSRAMALLGIRSIVSKSFPKKISRMTNKEKSLIVNLIKDLDINHINQVWTTDITYIKTIYEGTFYLITFIDYYSKKVISWGLFKNQKTDKILIVLKKAINKRKPKPGLIIHSDKGTQMRSKEYRKYLSKHNFIFSYTSLDHSCDENAAQESFHSLLKKEWLYQKKLYTFEDAYREIYNYIEGFYNPIRIHSSIGYVSPNDFEKNIENVKPPLIIV